MFMLSRTRRNFAECLLMKGYAPIHLACDRGHIDIVKLLLSRGAKQDVKVIPQLPAHFLCIEI